MTSAQSDATANSWRFLADNLPDVVFYKLIVDAEGKRRFTYISPAVERIHGVTPEQVYADGRVLYSQIHEADLPHLLSAEIESARTLQPFGVEARARTPRGEERLLMFRSAPSALSSGEIEWEGVEVDITNRIAAETALRESENRFRAIVDQSPFSIMVLSPSGDALHVNDAHCALWGITRELLASRGFNVFEDPQLEALGLLPYFRRAVCGERQSIPPIEYDLSATLGAGHRRIVQGELYPTRDAADRIVSVIVLHQDITDSARAAEALRAEMDFNRALVNRSPAFFVAIDGHGRTVMMNDSMLEALGYRAEEVVGRSYLECFVPADEKEPLSRIFDRVARAREHTTNVNRILAKDGRELVCEWRGIPIFDGSKYDFFLGVGIDITERRRAEEAEEKLQAQLRQAQKMESVARLAGGIAHDFNNMLGVILGIAENELYDMVDDHALRDPLMQIRDAGLRSAELTRQLLAFAREQAISPEVLDLNATVGSMLKLLRRLMGEDIELVWLPAEGLAPILMDPSQVDQLLANLCVNARDAISSRGRVVVETRNVLFDDDYCGAHLGFTPGEHVLLSVSDNGSGMTREVKERVFEPFFTTKPAGKGTGLGLSTVFGIVRQNDGFIDVYSEPGRGTTFNIYFRRHCDAQVAAVAAPSRDGTDVTGRGETALLVEDEPLLLEMGESMLERLGYRVRTASSPVRALEIAAELGDALDLLVTDVIMPEMTGRELYERLIGDHPRMRCLFVSGYTSEAIASPDMQKSGVGFLQKPFRLSALGRRLRELMQQ